MLSTGLPSGGAGLASSGGSDVTVNEDGVTRDVNDSIDETGSAAPTKHIASAAMWGVPRRVCILCNSTVGALADKSNPKHNPNPIAPCSGDCKEIPEVG